MSLELVDGFDQYGLDEDQMTAGNWIQVVRADLTQVAANVRTGTTAVLFDSSVLSSFIRRNFEFEGTDKIVCFAARNITQLPETAYAQVLCGFRDPDNLFQVTLYVMTTGQLRVELGDQVSAIESTLPVYSAGNYHSIQFKVHIDDTAGSFEVRLDNNTVAFNGPTTNLDTDPTGYGSTGQFHLGGNESAAHGDSSATPQWAVDDVFVLNDLGSINNDFVGDKQAFLILPDSDEATQDWSFTGAASAWEAISEVPADDDTSYIEATSVNDTSEFGLEDIATNITDIIGVQMSQVLRKLDAGIATVQGTLISNANDAVGANISVTENYAHHNDIIENNPDGDVPWTPTTWNAATYQIEKTS